MRSNLAIAVVLSLGLAAAGLTFIGIGNADAHLVSYQTQGSAMSNIVFPAANMSFLQQSGNLSRFMVYALNLPPVNSTLWNPGGGTECCIHDMDDRSVALNMSSVVILTSNATSMTMYYSSTGRLVEVAVAGAFGPPLSDTTWSSLVEHTTSLSNRLGLSGFPLSYEGSNDSGSTTVAAYSDPYLPALAFGNQLILTFDVGKAVATKLILFPWFTAPPPIVSAPQALETALGYLNRTVVAGNPWLSNGSSVSSSQVSLGLDSLRYSLVFHVEATYSAASHNPPGYPATVSYDYRVWVDAYNGTVVYWVWIPPPLGGSLAPGLPWLPWVLVLALTMSAVLVASLMLYLEPVEWMVGGLFLPLYFRLKRGSVLEHFVRGQVYAYLCEHPGATYSDLRDRFSLNNGTATYHLAVLQALGFISAKSEGRHKRFYAATHPGRQLGRALSDVQNQILEVVRDHGRATQSEIAVAAGVSRQRAAFNVRSLVRSGFLVHDPQLPRKYTLAGESLPDREGPVLPNDEHS